MERDFDLFLVTGATGFLGGTLTRFLLDQGKKVRVLVLPGDPDIASLPEGAEVCYGNVLALATLDTFFAGDLSRACLVHCAGIVSIATKREKILRRVNVGGTKNILNLALLHGVKRAIYVSSVHAIPTGKRGEIIRETDAFSPRRVRGQYAKSKAEATRYALSLKEMGLDLCVVHPSGILGPGDRAIGNTTGAILDFCRGTLPASVKGGYDFVDVRDLAQGIVQVANSGESGECYLLTGHYLTLNEIFTHLSGRGYGKVPKELPLWFIKALAPFFEWSSVVHRKKLFLTPYSAYTLGSNANFSHEKATAAFGYAPRPWQETLDDLVDWCRETGRLQFKPKTRPRRARRRLQKEE